MNKRGQTTIPLFTLIAISLVVVILFGAFLYFFGIVDTSLSGDIQAGQVKLSEESSKTIGKINATFLSTADLMGIFLLFGLVFAIIINGFMNRNSTLKLMFMIDFILIIIAYILAVYVSNSYETLLPLLPFKNLIAANMNTTSNFVLLLPIITIVTGFITMILTYSGIPRTREEAEVAGF